MNLLNGIVGQKYIVTDIKEKDFRIKLARLGVLINREIKIVSSNSFGVKFYSTGVSYPTSVGKEVARSILITPIN